MNTRRRTHAHKHTCIQADAYIFIATAARKRGPWKNSEKFSGWTGSHWNQSIKCGPTCTSEMSAKNKLKIKRSFADSSRVCHGSSALCVSHRSVARDTAMLSSLGVTHVLNAAAGRYRINTGQQFYSDLEYHGVEAADHPLFNLKPFFRPAAQFMDDALKKNGQQAIDSFKKVFNVMSRNECGKTSNRIMMTLSSNNFMTYYQF